MNHFPTEALTRNALPMTKRALAKLRTREALLDAARRLFSERGYEGATVRDIAAAANLSTGAVFANFSDKAEMFAEILNEDARRLARTMAQTAEIARGGVRERMAAVLASGYAFHLSQLPLLQAALSESWRHSPGSEAADRERKRPMRAVVERVLQDGVDGGELSSQLDIDLSADLVWVAYRSNYRFAAFDGFDLPALTARLERQLDLILGGLSLAKAA